MGRWAAGPREGVGGEWGPERRPDKSQQGREEERGSDWFRRKCPQGFWEDWMQVRGRGDQE